MRSSKSRSRQKQNRPRSIGNIINRVFDSSGPEGKVRGTPQQIIEKYLVLARDAQLSNDRVAAENFLQHAEHYTRMLAEAQRELAAEQEARRQQGGQPQQHAPNGSHHGGANGNGGGHDQGRDRRQADYARPRDEDPRAGSSGLVPVFPFDDPSDSDSGLVETPEMKSEPRRPTPEPEPPQSSGRAGESDRPAAREGSEPATDTAAGPQGAGVEPAANQRPRRPRGPRKPRETTAQKPAASE